MSKGTSPKADAGDADKPAAKTFSALGPIENWPPEFRRLLAEHGIDAEAFDAEFRCVGISSAFGVTPQAQAEIDAWIAAGGDPFAGGEGAA